jgi:hypothetical protein
MLEAVGHPIAVNPDGRLRLLAEQRQWRQLSFRRRSRWVRLTGPRRVPAPLREAARRRPAAEREPENTTTP